MPMDHDFSLELKAKLKKLFRQDRRRYEILMKKIDQIIENSDYLADHYKKLSNDLAGLQRVHIDKSFVLTFSIDKTKRFILFVDFDHHDNIYNK